MSSSELWSRIFVLVTVPWFAAHFMLASFALKCDAATAVSVNVG